MKPPEKESPGDNQGISTKNCDLNIIPAGNEVNTLAAFDPTKIRVSIFAGATGKKPVDVWLADVLADIRGECYAKQIAALRGYLPHDQERYDQDKKLLRAFTLSGTAKSRTEALQHSNLLQVDLDKLGDKLAGLRERLKHDPHVAFGFVSPSGKGLKLGVMIDGSQHAESVRAAKSYFPKTYQVEIDPRCKDRLRLCFVSHDPELWINCDAVTLPIMDGDADAYNSSASCVLINCIPASLHNCVTTSLYHRPEMVLENLKARASGLALLKQAHPKLEKLYLTLVDNRFQARESGRNDFVVDAVTFLYRAVTVRFVSLLVGCFYDCNRALFNDSREQHMNETAAMLAGVIRSYVKSLTPIEREIYEILPEDESDVFRICRDLAMLLEPNREPFTFFISFGHLGDRIGIHPMRAQRIMRRLAIAGLMTPLEKGTRRQEGCPSKAGTYKWLLQPQLKGTMP